MLKITRRNGRTVRLEGRLTRDEVGLLREALRGSGRPDALDLTGLGFLDEAGASALRELRRGGVALEGASSFVQALLGGLAS